MRVRCEYNKVANQNGEKLVFVSIVEVLLYCYSSVYVKNAILKPVGYTLQRVAIGRPSSVPVRSEYRKVGKSYKTFLPFWKFKNVKIGGLALAANRKFFFMSPLWGL